MRIAILLLAAAAAQAQAPLFHLPAIIPNSPVGFNFPRDLLGPIDTRDPGGVCNVGPCIWGNADSDTAKMVFFPPQGYRTVITGITGNLMAFIKSLPGDPKTPLESTAGILGGIQSTSGFNGLPANQYPCTICAPGTPVFVLGVLSEKMDTTTVPINFTGRFYLDADNTLVFKVADYLNTTLKPVHMELTGSIFFEWEQM